MDPRIYCIPATGSTVVAVLRRGPSSWCQVGRWDPAAGTWEPGAWIRATVYPQRCDVSPDGRWLVAFMLKAGARWAAGGTYISVSRLPWLTSLAAWGTDGTWTRGLAFVEADAARSPVSPPDQGDVGPLLRRFGLEPRRPATFAIERARGWIETSASPPFDPADPWEIRRAAHVTLAKPRPGEAATRLLVRGWYAAFREGEPRTGPPAYSIEREGAQAAEPLPEVQWADWAPDGRLLVATGRGALEVRDEPAAPPASRIDLAALRPSPTPPPPEAFVW